MWGAVGDLEEIDDAPEIDDGLDVLVLAHNQVEEQISKKASSMYSRTSDSNCRRACMQMYGVVFQNRMEMFLFKS